MNSFELLSNAAKDQKKFTCAQSKMAKDLWEKVVRVAPPPKRKFDQVNGKGDGRIAKRPKQ